MNINNLNKVLQQRRDQVKASIVPKLSDYLKSKGVIDTDEKKVFDWVALKIKSSLKDTAEFNAYNIIEPGINMDSTKKSLKSLEGQGLIKLNFDPTKDECYRVRLTSYTIKQVNSYKASHNRNDPDKVFTLPASNSNHGQRGASQKKLRKVTESKSKAGFKLNPSQKNTLIGIAYIIDKNKGPSMITPTTLKGLDYGTSAMFYNAKNKLQKLGLINVRKVNHRDVISISDRGRRIAKYDPNKIMAKLEPKSRDIDLFHEQYTERNHHEPYLDNHKTTRAVFNYIASWLMTGKVKNVSIRRVSKAIGISKDASNDCIQQCVKNGYLTSHGNRSMRTLKLTKKGRGMTRKYHLKPAKMNVSNTRFGFAEKYQDSIMEKAKKRNKLVYEIIYNSIMANYIVSGTAKSKLTNQQMSDAIGHHDTRSQISNCIQVLKNHGMIISMGRTTYRRFMLPKSKQAKLKEKAQDMMVHPDRYNEKNTSAPVLKVLQQRVKHSHDNKPVVRVVKSNPFQDSEDSHKQGNGRKSDYSKLIADKNNPFWTYLHSNKKQQKEQLTDNTNDFQPKNVMNQSSSIKKDDFRPANVKSIVHQYKLIFSRTYTEQPNGDNLRIKGKGFDKLLDTTQAFQFLQSHSNPTLWALVPSSPLVNDSSVLRIDPMSGKNDVRIEQSAEVVKFFERYTKPGNSKYLYLIGKPHENLIIFDIKNSHPYYGD